MSNKKPDPEISEFTRHLLSGAPSLEMVTLKGHLWIETRLRSLLALRLGVREDRLPRLSFSQVAALASCGLGGQIVEGLTLINQIRNSFAHEIRPVDQSDRIRRLVDITEEGPWPDTSGDQLNAYAKAIAHTAGHVRGLADGLSDVCPKFDSKQKSE